MDKEINKSIPIMFQKINCFETNDTRFTNVSIWLMHLEENLNGSFFSKESVEKAIPTLANTPILAYIEDNKNNEIDASDHREVLIKEDGKYKMKYLGQAYGVIPESCNPRFQTRVCDDGTEREFLVVDGLIWSAKFEDIDTILKRDNIKGQSMELHDEISGYFDKEDGLYHFTDFKFYGACILGDFVQPAMRSSTVEVMNFSVDEFTKTINSKMEEFKQYTISQKGGNLVEDNKVENIEQTQEVKDEFATVITTKSNEQTTVVETIDTDSYKVEETKVETTSVEVKETVDQTNGVDNQDVSMMGDYSSEEVIEQPTEETVVEEVSTTEEVIETVEVSEQPIEESFSVLESEEYKTLENKFTQLEQQFNALVEENNKLKEFKAIKETEELKGEVDKISSEFALEEAEISDLRNKAYSKEISIEEYQEKLFALVGKKNFSKVEKVEKEEVEQPVTFSLKSTETCPYPSLSQYFQ